MISKRLRLKGTAAAGTLCVFALALHGGAQAADSVVPSAWNVAPMTSGAYREAFDTALPDWAGRVGASAVSAVFPEITGMPVRPNAWFSANAKVLQLDTIGEVLTNSLAYPNSEGSVVFDVKPVYVDMRIRFEAIADYPDLALLNNAKLAVYVSADRKLVVSHVGGVTTNDVQRDTNVWYQVTVKLYNNQFDVLLNDAPVFTGLGLKNVGGANTLSAVNFSGTGLIDELYVSHGSPAYAVVGPTGPIPALPPAGSNPPTDEEQTMINAWLDNYPGITTGTTLDLTQDELSSAYLLNELGGDGDTATAFEYTFGISKIDLVSPTSLVITLSLEADGSNKSGPINGRIQLQGKKDTGDWDTLSGAVTPSYADFTDGEATYTFTIPAEGYKFFKPLIVP